PASPARVLCRSLSLLSSRLSPSFPLNVPALLLPYSLFFNPLRPPPSSTLLPYTTLFRSRQSRRKAVQPVSLQNRFRRRMPAGNLDRKSTRLNSSHVSISYAVFCLKKKKKNTMTIIKGSKRYSQMRVLGCSSVIVQVGRLT